MGIPLLRRGGFGLRPETGWFKTPDKKRLIKILYFFYDHPVKNSFRISATPPEEGN